VKVNGQIHLVVHVQRNSNVNFSDFFMRFLANGERLIQYECRNRYSLWLYFGYWTSSFEHMVL